jgi:AcrR family transcriptional regulator
MTDPSPKVPRRERERLRHRQEILDAARRIAADRGIEGLTVEQVAKQAEFAVGSIYRHFASKEELILAVVGDFADAMFDEMAAIVGSSAPFLERLDRFVRRSLEQQADCRPLFEALMALPGSLPAPGSEAAQRMEELHRRHLALLESVVAAGEEAGVLRPGARLSQAIALGSLLIGFAKAGTVLPGLDAPAEIVRSFLDGARVRGGDS